MPMPVGIFLNTSDAWIVASEMFFRLFAQSALAAASRTFWTAGTSKAMRMAIMAITTNNSISVNPRHRVQRSVGMLHLHKRYGMSTRSESKPDGTVTDRTFEVLQLSR